MSHGFIKTLAEIYLFIGLVVSVSAASYKMQAESTKKILATPNYPSSYNQRLSYSWTIKANTSFTDPIIKVNVLDSELEYSLGCFYDYATIYDGSTTLHGSMTTWCGTKYPSSTLTSLYNTIIVEFETDSQNNNYRGFRLEYWAEQRVVSKYGPATLTSFNYVVLGIGCAIIFAIFVTMIAIAIARTRMAVKKI